MNEASDSVMSPGEVVTLFGVPWEPRTRRFTKALGDGFDVRACYCSIHEECWQTALSQARPEPVARCD